MSNVEIISNKLVSIIILNHNGKGFLEKCVNSVLNQTYKNIEVIFVDNASTDGSAEFIRLHFPGVKIIKNKVGLGFAGGNNSGIKNAKGELILLLSNDAWIESSFLKEVIKYYESNSFDVVAPREAKYNKSELGKYHTTLDFFGHNVFLKDYGIEKKKSPFYLTGVCLLFSKRLYSDTRGLDPNFFLYFEDADWFWRLQLLKKKFTYIDNLRVYHAGAGSSGGVEKKTLKYLLFLYRNQNSLQMILKNYSLSTLVWVVPLYVLQNIFEILFFLIILKPKIAYTYLLGWQFNIRNIRKILTERRWIQRNRCISDQLIFKNMYFGFGKLYHLKTFIFGS